MKQAGDTIDDYGLNRFRETVSRKTDEGFFDRDRPVIITRAPGRLDLMGGIADYSGSLVLQYPIREATFAAAQLSADKVVRIESLMNAETPDGYRFDAEVSDLSPGGRFGGAADARSYFAEHPDERWAAYGAGAFVVLGEEFGASFGSGVRILVRSDVPLGKGVSSSAALEVSVMKAITGLCLSGDNARPMTCRTLAQLCQRVENEIVGAPCGVMDQMASACASENELVEILCQPAELLGTVRLPNEIGIWGIDSGIRHSVSGADYRTVRTAAAMGYRIIAELAGLSIQNAGPGRVAIFDDKWSGYLANIDADSFRATYEAELPESVTGREFVSTFYGVSDRFAAIDPEGVYPIRAATAHPVYENARVRRFSRLIREPEPDLAELGDLMYGSHDSYSACGLGSDGTDLLVELVKEAGRRAGVFGAKITGGGSGGTVAILGRRDGGGIVDEIAGEYRRRTRRMVHVFSGSSPGAWRFGSIVHL